MITSHITNKNIKMKKKEKNQNKEIKIIKNNVTKIIINKKRHKFN